MIYGLLGLLLASALTLPSWAADEEKTTIVPVTKAPFHIFTFQDENMALENVTLPAGRSTTYHSHNQDLFFVIIKGAKIKNQVLGKDPVDIDFKQDNIYFANYTKTPGTHQITNVEPENTMWLLGMAIIHREAGRFTPSSRPAKYEATLENERVRSWRLKLGLGETAPVIKQMAPGARFVVAGGDAVEKRPGKPDQPLILKSGDFMEQSPEERSLENIGNSPIEIVEVELK